MCSWFCETFCCFLLRCRDSYTPNTSTTYNNQSRNTNTVNRNRPRDLEETGDTATTFRSSVRGECLANEQPKPRQAMPPLGNSWQQGRDKTLPPMLPILKGSEFHYASDHDGINTGRAETVMSESSIGQGRVDDSLGDVGLYSSSVLMNVFAASARSPGIFKSQPATPATAVFATFQFKEPGDRSQSCPTELSTDISPRTPHSNGPTLAEPIKFSKFYSSSVARPFSGRTNYSGSTYRE